MPSVTGVAPGQFLGTAQHDFVRFLGEAESSHEYQIKMCTHTHTHCRVPPVPQIYISVHRGINTAGGALIIRDSEQHMCTLIVQWWEMYSDIFRKSSNTSM